MTKEYHGEPKNTSLTKQRTEIRFRAKIKENFLAVQWLRLGAFTAVGLDSIPGWGTKILQATWRGKNKTKLKILVHRASLVAQWLRICLPMQGTRVRALVWEDPTCRGATRPVSHNC